MAPPHSGALLGWDMPTRAAHRKRPPPAKRAGPESLDADRGGLVTYCKRDLSDTTTT